MYSLTVKNHKGSVLQLTGNADYSIYKIDGLNPPPATINNSVNTTTDGSKINSVRLENRNIVIYIKPERNIEQNRIKLYKYFPSKQTVTLYFKNGSRDVYISGVVETLELNHFENPQIAQVSIICPDPYFKDTKELSVELGDISPVFEFPFSIPEEGVEFSTYIANNRKNIINTSDVETGLIIKLFATGEVINPVIYDITSKKQMRLNITMKASDTIIINTNVDNKSVTLIRDGVTTNALGYMRPDSKWFTLSAGDNIFTYECESGGSNLFITFTASVLYSGV